MPDRPLSPDALAAFADPRYLSSDAATATPMEGSANWMRRAGLPSIAAGQGLDAATTLLALRDPRMHEANAFFGASPSPGRVLGTKAAVMTPLALLLDTAYAHAPAGSGRRKALMAAAVATGALGAFTGAHNLQTLGR